MAQFPARDCASARCDLPMMTHKCWLIAILKALRLLKQVTLYLYHSHFWGVYRAFRSCRLRYLLQWKLLRLFARAIWTKTLRQTSSIFIPNWNTFLYFLMMCQKETWSEDDDQMTKWFFYLLFIDMFYVLGDAPRFYSSTEYASDI